MDKLIVTIRKSPTELEDEARGYFEQRLNCAQSVFAPFASRLGLDLDTAMKIATPFGGGMSHTGQVCGAVSGALLAIGLYRGVTEYDKVKKDACYELAREFQERFKSELGGITCPNLLGVDISSPDVLQQARALELFENICPEFVAGAVRILCELLEYECANS